MTCVSVFGRGFSGVRLEYPAEEMGVSVAYHAADACNGQIRSDQQLGGGAYPQCRDIFGRGLVHNFLKQRIISGYAEIFKRGKLGNTQGRAVPGVNVGQRASEGVAFIGYLAFSSSEGDKEALKKQSKLSVTEFVLP